MLKAVVVVLASAALMLGLLAACTVPPPVVTVSGSPAEPTAIVPLPQVVDQLGGESLAVAVDGNTAYLGVGPRVVAIDASDPTNPQVVGESPILPGIVQGIALADGHIMAAAAAGLHVLDVQAPTPLQLSGTVSLEVTAQQVSTSGTSAFVVAGDCHAEACHGSLYVADLSDPTSPQIVGQLGLPDMPMDVEGPAETLVVGHGQGVTVVQAAAGRPPEVLATVDLPGGVRDVELDGQVAFAAGGGNVHVLDLTNPITPTRTSTYTAVPAANALALADGLLYVGEAFCEFDLCGSTVLALDRSRPAQLAESGLFRTSGALTDMHVAGDLAFLALAEEGLQVVDVAEPAKARVLGRLAGLGSATDLAPLGGDLVVAGGAQGGLQVWSVDRGVVNRVDGSRWANGLELVGSMGYVPAWEDGLQVIDFREPLTPTVTNVITPALLGGAAYAVALAEPPQGQPPAAYVALGGGGLAAVNMDTVGKLQVAGWLEQGGETWAVAMAPGRQDLVFVVGGIGEEDQRRGFLRTVDVADPAAPALLAEIRLPVEAWDVAVGPEGTVYVASSGCSATGCQGQLAAIDISDPAQPQVTGVLDLPWTAISLTVDGERAYVAAGEAGVGVASLVDPRQPILLGVADTPGSARRVVVHDGQLVVADGAGGVVFLEEQLEMGW